jgi:cellulose synthase (UDP-forming)
MNRRLIADARQGSALLDAPTDVLIATYNEAAEILERTMVGALAIEHADLRVWILDDGNRAWVRGLAESLGVHYVARDKGKHAKAGNVNNGVAHALRTGRRPEFFLLLDADFVPKRAILKRVLGLFEEHDVGIVQTPQHFFNYDPVQRSLLCEAAWPDEQRLFFNVLLPAKDAWGAAFCCGTSAVFRVEAFERAGGMATETVTEDMLTSFRFGGHGYRTIFLNERLSRAGAGVVDRLCGAALPLVPGGDAAGLYAVVVLRAGADELDQPALVLRYDPTWICGDNRLEHHEHRRAGTGGNGVRGARERQARRALWAA